MNKGQILIALIKIQRKINKILNGLCHEQNSNKSKLLKKVKAKIWKKIKKDLLGNGAVFEQVKFLY